MDKTVYIYTLGCKVNWCDSETMAAAAQKIGCTRVDNIEEAQVCIINTCTVTKNADASARKIIRRVKRLNSKCFIIVCGCYAATDYDTLSSMAEVDRVLSKKEEKNFGLILAEVFNQISPTIELKNSQTLADRAYQSSDRHRGFVKIQDGCQQFCAYCKVPYARSILESKPTKEVMAEIESYAAAGYQELVITGIHIAKYNDQGRDLPALLHQLGKSQLIPRIRISSLESNGISDELIEIFSAYDCYMPQLHIPLQSGSDKVLKLMNRAVDRKSFLDGAQRFLAYSDLATITADMIVGLPGEEREDFEQTLEIVEQIPFAKIHIFPFSPREGTKASQMTDLFVHNQTIHDREKELMAAAQIAGQRCRDQFKDRKLKVLIEQKDEKGFQGFSENYLRVRTTQENLQENVIVELDMSSEKNTFVKQ